MLRTTKYLSLRGVHHISASYCAMRVVATALLLLATGCQTTDPFAQWAHKEKQADKLSSQVADKSSDTKSPRPSVDSAEQQIKFVQRGQTEIAAWYRDGLQSHLQSAKMNFSEAVQANPQNADAHHGLGIVADLEKDFATAEMHYQKALIYRPNDSRILGDLGYSYLLQNRLTESEQFLQRALQADPQNVNATKHLGDVQASKGQIELAKMTYGQVMSPDAVEQALYQQNTVKPGSEVQLANHEAEEPSFFDRLMQREPEKDPTQEIRDAMAQERERSLKEREERERMRQLQNRANPYANLHPTRVREQLEAIDREAYQPAQNTPVFIDDQTGSLQRIPAQTPWSGVSQQPQRPQPEPQRPTQSQHQYQSQVQTQSQIQTQPQHQSTGQYSQQPQQQYHTQQGPYAPTPQNIPVGYQSQAPESHAMGSQHGVPAVNALHPEGRSSRVTQQQPNRVPHTSTQHIRNQYYENSHSIDEQSQITQAQHAVPQPSNPHTQVYQQGMAPQQNAYQPQHNTVPQAADVYSQASKDAVRMGMGLSTTSPTTPRTSPGMGTHFNAPSFGQPQRILPTDLPPQDLRKAYEMTASEQAPPLNSHGQQLPSSAPPTMSQEQFATASRYNITQQQPYVQQHQPHLPTQQLEAYDEQRQAVDQSLNNTIQQAWGERQAGGQLTPAGGPVAVERPDQFAGMGQREIVQPAPWPHQTQPTQTAYGYPDSDRYQQSQQSQGRVVTPPPYNAQITPQRPDYEYNSRPVNQAPSTQRAPSRQYGQSQNSYRNEVSANGLPMIIPADR